ncbi:MAG: sigma-70 family RNA polymerase sigma factor [Deltaproteobacteria bacterium]|nr:sigma-70 family RNA polymerase sigma factor [Deltaproteobacteria bacterium]
MRSEHEGLEVAPLTGPTVGAAELFRAHAAFVASFVHRLGVPERDVPDVVQEVFVVVHRKGGFVMGSAQPRTWVAAIAVRLAAQYRRRRREELDGAATERAASGGSTPAHEAEVRQAMARVQACLDGLDAEHREVFVLFEVAGESCKDIAEALAIPVGTVYSRIHHARRRFAVEHARRAADEVEGER